VPLDWPATQYNLGLALSSLGERESGTEKLTEAVAAYREALKEYTRAHPAPMGDDADESRPCAFKPRARENGTEKLEEAIAAYREALKEFISSNNYATGATLVPEQARGKFALRLKCGTVL